MIQNAKERYLKRRRKIAPFFLSFLSGMLFLALVTMVGGLVWMAGMRRDGQEINMHINSMSVQARTRQNEDFLKWLIDEGNFRDYSTMREAIRAFEEYGSEMRRKKEELNYREEILRLMKARGQKT